VTDFVWVAGRPALDLCNTRIRGVDLLRTPGDLGRWLREAELASRPPRLAESEFRAVLALRDALRGALVEGDAGEVCRLASCWLERVPGHLSVDADTMRPCFLPRGGSAGCALTPAVLDALDLAREAPGRVRECASEACRAVYLDASRNHSKRWCSMQRCGARAKAAAYYRRHRAGTAPAT
jgi:predicted RNA-binding Zn ribbon-like protein